MLTFRGFRVGPTASATTWTLAVSYADGIDANLDQVRNGFAWVYEKYITVGDPSAFDVGEW